MHDRNIPVYLHLARILAFCKLRGRWLESHHDMSVQGENHSCLLQISLPIPVLVHSLPMPVVPLQT